MLYPQLINAQDLLQQYDRGCRYFTQSKLQSIDLSQADLSGANLSFAQQVHGE